MEIKTSDLITLQNHARAFKQNDFIFYNHKLYNTLDSNIFAVTTFVPIEFSEPMIINYRQLNAFMKTITIETKFEFQYSKNSRYIINTSGDILNIEEPSQYTMSLFYNRVDYINKISIYNKVFKPKIESGELLGDSIWLQFTNVKNGDRIYLVTRKINSISLPIGEYKVTGTIGLSSHRDKGTLIINDVDVKITKTTKSITLFGTIYQALIFSEDKFRHGTPSGARPSAYTISNYSYIFAESYIGDIAIFIWNSTYNIPVHENTYYYFTKDVNMLDYLSNLTNAFK